MASDSWGLEQLACCTVLIASVFAAVSLQAQAVVKVASNTGVKVKKNTLFYVGGQMKVSDYTDGSKKVSNEGNIKVTGDFTNANSDGSNFVNVGASGGNYGQLIISQNGVVSGKITSQIKYNRDFIYHSLAIPYDGITAKEVVAQSYPGKTDGEVVASFVGYNGKYNGKNYFDPNRKDNPLFVWSNAKYYLKNLGVSDKIDPVSYYALNKGSKLGAFDTSSFTLMKGKPSNASKSVSIDSYVINNNKGVNDAGEYYGSYTIDYTVAAPAGWTDYSQTVDAGGFGSNIFNFGNPYTSNIDLSKLNRDFYDKIKVIAQYTSQKYSEDINKGKASGSVNSGAFKSYVPSDGTGDIAVTIVRPFQTFSVKMKENFGSASIKFGDNIKTFDIPSTITSPVQNILYNKKQDVKEGVNQVGLDLYDASGNNTGNRAYVVASNIYEASQRGEGTEVYNIAIGNGDTAIYTLQETEDGNIDKNLAYSKTYINGVNADKYVGKPIHLVFQNGKGHYTLKARLNEDLLNNKNKFYFEDKITGKVVEINKDFEYSFDVNGTDKDRFVLYWAKKPQKVNDKELANETTANTVVIFKKDTNHLIRFNKPSDNKAKVFVYNISGQLVVSETVDTAVDYVIPVKGNSSVYIVKVVEGNGKVTTKKIIK